MENAREKVLIVGSAGYVGSIVRPTLQQHFHCRHMDLRPVPNVEPQDMIIGDVNDAAAVDDALRGVDAVIYMAMGLARREVGKPGVGDVQAAFQVNVAGLYRVLRAGLAAGVRRFVATSTLSVYDTLSTMEHVDESIPANAWEPYGLSKRVAEFLCQAAWQSFPDAVITVARLNYPRNEADFQPLRFDPACVHNCCALGPQDLSDLYLACLRFRKPGCHIFQASGDMTGQRMSNALAGELLGWQPANR